MGLFSLYKPKEYNYRFIYYDKKKEAAKEREKKFSVDENEIPGEYKPTIKRGTFREMAQRNNKMRSEQIRNSNLRLILIVVLLVAIAYFLLK